MKTKQYSYKTTILILKSDGWDSERGEPGARASRLGQLDQNQNLLVGNKATAFNI